ncbi:MULTISPECIES: carboxymuconolactone decarboxylase family protein [unclassified Rhodococcus (in: high G+C Gram-positive bacteria)]|uniref:carboxymuconolactone decarboxylase family protein n=1 Tax=unclassified Rhodococcus (in: high G+C Gram-positive bacteria) TaxID=192944 RepID=UPI00163AF374|nr:MULTISPECIES: carboxymuconolactone decarboxylase family protein [unclassified Rhodococcus (in: high G+C Gram-positive bacteria)]MBC2640893.1 carboxymuconolactone decarboxylase family protein [Rhodococcus sp. 3A]MBC2894363.1 carboxymuconolactone decarboxylase family protein [Rhodococcus sp. 4CII]
MNESQTPTTPGSATSDRMPMPPAEELSAEQQAAAHRVAAGPRGAVFGPFVPLLRSPQAMEHLQHLGAYLRFESPLPNKIFEMLVLLVAREWDQDFEWAYHLPLARGAGLSDEAIDALVQRSVPPDLTPAEESAYEIVLELFADKTVSDATFNRGIEMLGPQSVTDVVVTAGYYSTLAMVMNMARTPPPV